VDEYERIQLDTSSGRAGRIICILILFKVKLTFHICGGLLEISAQSLIPQPD